MSKKDKDVRGPFAIQIGGKELDIYVTDGSVDLSLSSSILEGVSWEQIEESISIHMKSLATIMTDLSKSISQLGTALRSGDPRIR